VKLNNYPVMIFSLSLIILLTACQPAAGSELTPITLQLAWTHSAQFAGFYAAEQQGYYAEEGLAVTFIEGGGAVDRLQPVLAGEADFGLGSGAELVTARAASQPVKAVAAILRRDPFAFFALADSGISRPEDFVGKTIQIRPRSLPFLQAVTGRVGVTPEQYVADYEADFEDLYTGKVDVAVGFITSQRLEAEQAGYQLSIIYPDDYGVHFYSDIIFTTDDFVANHPDLVTRFLRATFKGWTYTIENSTEVGNLVAQYNPEADPELENVKMLASLPLINTGEDYIGWMRPEVWEGMVETLETNQAITRPVEAGQVYTVQFLQEIYTQK
jgi:NitT/TauT family transport system substrate-binding protein